MKARVITGYLFRVNYATAHYEFIEIESNRLQALDDLRRYCAAQTASGRLVSGANLINSDGSTPKVSVLQSKVFKETLRELQKNL